MNTNLPHSGGASEVECDGSGTPDRGASTATFEASTLPPSSGTRAATAGDGCPAGQVLGDYELLDKLGEGGMGVVYRARQRSANRIVALKLIRPERLADLEPQKRQQWLDRFQAEAQATARLEHEHIVTVYEVGSIDGVPFYSMRHVEGRTLADVVREGPLENRRAAAVLEPVARAVDHAHRAGILHRDLKPRNILVANPSPPTPLPPSGARGERTTPRPAWGERGRGEGFGVPFVTDFGLAKWLTEESRGVTQTDQVMGTPEYMSPEQARDSSQVTAASDLYSLGATLYDLVTGRPPFQAASSVETLRQVMDEEPVAPRQLNPAIDRDLETITLKCLAKESARRYGSAADLADDLRRYLNGEPIHARPVFLPERAWRWSRRHPAAAAAIAAVLIGLAFVSVLSAALWSINKRLVISIAAETNAKNDAESKRVEAVQAREAETEAKNEAVAKEKETKQAFDFLIQSFRKPDPDADGEQLTVAELFGQAVEQLDTTFPNQPRIQARLLNAIGQTYYGLGLYQKAIEVFERARDLHRNELGEDHEDTLMLMNNLAEQYRSTGRLAEALPLFEQTLKLRKAKLGPEHQDTLRSMHNLATAYYSAGRLAEALPLYEQTVELKKARLGPEHPETLMSMNNLAEAYRSADRLAEAISLNEQTLELRKAKLGPEHPDTLQSMNNLANAFASAGRLAEALPLYEQTVELKKARLGPEHPETLISMGNLASTYWFAGRVAEVVQLLEQTLELMRSKLGPEHPTTLISIGNLAKAYLVGEQPEKALPLFDRFIAVHRGRATPDDPTFAGRVAAVSLDLLKHRQYPAAETYLRECLAIREMKLPDDWVLFNTKSMLGAALAGQKKFQEAEPLLVEGYSGMKEREANIPPAAKTRLPEAIRRLVDLYTAWEKPDEAAKWQKLQQ